MEPQFLHSLVLGLLRTINLLCELWLVFCLLLLRTKGFALCSHSPPNLLCSQCRKTFLCSKCSHKKSSLYATHPLAPALKGGGKTCPQFARHFPPRLILCFLSGNRIYKQNSQQNSPPIVQGNFAKIKHQPNNKIKVKGKFVLQSRVTIEKKGFREAG